jgi:hypothetical protein
MPSSFIYLARAKHAGKRNSMFEGGSDELDIEGTPGNDAAKKN